MQTQTKNPEDDISNFLVDKNSQKLHNKGSQDFQVEGPQEEYSLMDSKFLQIQNPLQHSDIREDLTVATQPLHQSSNFQIFCREEQPFGSQAENYRKDDGGVWKQQARIEQPREHKMRETRVQGNGNCLCRTIVLQCNGNKHLLGTVQADLVHSMNNNSERYQSNVGWEMPCTADLNQLVNNGAQCGEPQIRPLCDLQGVNLLHLHVEGERVPKGLLNETQVRLQVSSLDSNFSPQSHHFNSVCSEATQDELDEQKGQDQQPKNQLVALGESNSAEISLITKPNNSIKKSPNQKRQGRPKSEIEEYEEEYKVTIKKLELQLKEAKQPRDRARIKNQMNAKKKRRNDKRKETKRNQNIEKLYDYYLDPIRTDQCNSLLKDFNKIQPARTEDRDGCKRLLKEIFEPEIEDENSSESEEEKEFKLLSKRQRK